MDFEKHATHSLLGLAVCAWIAGDICRVRLVPGLSCRSIATYRPRRDGMISHSDGTPAALQLSHGWLSITLQRTRRLLQMRQACFARVVLLADDGDEGAIAGRFCAADDNL